VAIFQGQGLTQDAHDAAMEEVSGRSRPESPSDRPVEGLLVHIAGQTETGFRILDVWASPGATAEWQRQITPELDKAGILVEGDDGRPVETYPVHALVGAHTPHRQPYRGRAARPSRCATGPRQRSR